MAVNYTVKESITQALIRLMDAKPYEKITVTDIVQKSGVCRASFYRNYVSKDDVLRKYIKYAMNSCPEYYREPADYDERHHIYGICETIRENRTLFDVLKKNQLMHLLHEQIFSMAIDYVNYHKLRYGRYELAFLSHAALGILLEWINTGCRESKEELADLFFRLLRMPGDNR